MPVVLFTGFSKCKTSLLSKVWLVLYNNYFLSLVVSIKAYNAMKQTVVNLACVSCRYDTVATDRNKC